MSVLLPQRSGSLKTKVATFSWLKEEEMRNVCAANGKLAAAAAAGLHLLTSSEPWASRPPRNHRSMTSSAQRETKATRMQKCQMRSRLSLLIMAPTRAIGRGNKLALTTTRARLYFITADGDATRLCSLLPKWSSWRVASYRGSGFLPAGSFFWAKRATRERNSERRKCKTSVCFESRWWGSSVTTTTKIHVTESTEASAGQNIFRTINT